MLTIKKKPKTPNMIWDAKSGKPLCKFDRKGVIETNDADLAEKLKALGHTVSGELDRETNSADQDSQEQGETPAADISDGADQEEKAETTKPTRRSRK